MFKKNIKNTLKWELRNFIMEIVGYINNIVQNFVKFAQLYIVFIYHIFRQ